MMLEGYSYRTSSRFGSRVKIKVDPETVTITGPRVGIPLYRAWIGAQVIFLTLTILAFLAAAIFQSWIYLVLGIIFLGCHAGVGGFGAGCLWELENLIEFGAGVAWKSASFPRMSVTEILIGPGWARRGMWLLILPYVALINKTSEGYCVSFEAPDGERDGDRVYALHMRTKEDARRLADCLRAAAPPGA